MQLIKVCSKAIVLSLVVVTMFAVESAAQQSQLGKVDFPVTGSEQAKAHFLRGVAALHSFWYEEALEAFRESTRVDPNFMMGYWGEAMAHNHPLWSQQDTEAAVKALEKIKDTSKLTPRERAYIDAVRVLYGKGDKLTRDIAYSEAMEKLYRDYPDDLEAAAFYSLSLLGTVRPGDKGFRRQMRAGAIAMDVFQKNPNHPGAAHYIIHSFDDPEHAILALPAARRYAEIAPEAHHARHMPSHIFLQLGMWPEAAASNESAWAASDAWVKRKRLSKGLRDYHSLSWLLYVYLQQGRNSKAEELLLMMRQSMDEAGGGRLRRTYAYMLATSVIETQHWELAGRLLTSAEEKAGGQSADSGEHSAHGAARQSSSGRSTAPPASPYNWYGQSVILLARGLAAVETGALAEADKIIAELQTVRKQLTDKGEAYDARQVEIMGLEVNALASAKRGNNTGAIQLMKRATALEEEMSPPSGPPDLIKPSHELFGEILLQMGRAKEAAQQFSVSLLRQPNRARSLLGAARAAAQSGDRAGAIAAYTNLLQIWKQADEELPELRQARQYLGQASTN